MFIVATEVHLSISTVVSTAKLLYVPVVSMASGRKRCIVVKFESLVNLLASALFADSIRSEDVFCIWNSAKVCLFLME